WFNPGRRFAPCASVRRVWRVAIMSAEPSTSEFLTANQVMARYGNVSHMWIVRKQRDDAFPSAVRFGGRLRFFRLSELVEWERSKIAGELKLTKEKAKRRAA